MEFELLDQDKKKALEKRHRGERDSRVCDRIKAVLLKSEGWTDRQIAKALKIHEETVHKHLKDWLNEKKLAPENGGAASKLSDAQTKALEAHLESQTYTEVKQFAPMWLRTSRLLTPFRLWPPRPCVGGSKTNLERKFFNLLNNKVIFLAYPSDGIKNACQCDGGH